MSGASARLSRIYTPVETGTPPRRKELASFRFRLKPKTPYTLPPVSSSNRTHFVQLRFDGKNVEDLKLWKKAEAFFHSISSCVIRTNNYYITSLRILP